MKGKALEFIQIPQQASWMVRKIFGARTGLLHLQADRKKLSVIKHIYLQLLGVLPIITWRSLLFHNSARPKVVFLIWLQV